MINLEKVYRLYDTVIENKDLTTKLLNELGFNSKEIKSLIEDGTLERVKRGHYVIKNVDRLFHYGKGLVFSKKYTEATACFEKCYELDPNHNGTCFQLFLRCIQSKDYNKAFEYFDRFYNSDNKYYNADSDYYLFLLSMITEIPENHREYAKYIRYEDIRVNPEDKRYKDVVAQNKVRSFSLYQKFTMALKELDKSIKTSGRSVQCLIIRTLLVQAKEVQLKEKHDIAKLANEKRYEDIILYLEAKKDRRKLNDADYYTLFLAYELCRMLKTGIIPKRVESTTNKLFDVIRDKNFELALQLSLDYLNKTNVDPKDNIIAILLGDIVDFIKSKKELPIEKVEVPEVAIPTEKNEPKETEEQKKEPISSFDKIFKCLLEKDLNSAITFLRSYLVDIDKEEYEFFITDLMKLSLIEEDYTFIRPMRILSCLSNGTYEFNISEYLSDFYETLLQKRFDETKLYFDIISRSNLFSKNMAPLELEEILVRIQESMDPKKNKLSEDVDSTLLETNVTTKPTIVPIIDDVPEVNVVPFGKEEKSDTIVDEQIDESFIIRRQAALETDKIILLDPMKNEDIEKVMCLANIFPDVDSFVIGDEHYKQVVLRYKPKQEFINIWECAKKGNIAYRNKDYDTCISCYERLLSAGKPKFFVFMKLGCAYMKKGDKDRAIKFLTIASNFSDKGKERYNFAPLIAKLKGIPEDNLKPTASVELGEFTGAADSDYGIEMDTVIEFISAGISIDEISKMLNLDQEHKTLAILLLGREYYARENYELGDSYLRMAEKEKDKTVRVRSLLDEIRKGKKFYKNRLTEDAKNLKFIPNEQK